MEHNAQFWRLTQLKSSIEVRNLKSDGSLSLRLPDSKLEILRIENDFFWFNGERIYILAVKGRYGLPEEMKEST